MPTRRNFLKASALTGAAVAGFPVNLALAQDDKSARPDPRFFRLDEHILARNPPPRVITIPDVQAPDGKAYKVLKGDFHMHTLFSDGNVMPLGRVQEAVQNGLDCISITDHIEIRPHLGSGHLRLAEHNDNHNIAYTMAKPEADRRNLILIQGTEITKKTMPPGHFNALFIQDANKIAEVVDDWQKMLAVAVDQGGFICWNHPGWVAPNDGGLERGEPMSFSDAHEDVRKRGLLHGVEVFNYSSWYPAVSDWCNERDLSILAVSDAHSSELHQYGLQNPRRPITLVLAEERSEASIRDAFFAHRTIGWVADMIFGSPEWVEKLFKTCTEVSGTGNTRTIKNKSDIPMQLRTGQAEYELPPQGEVAVRYTPGSKLTVENWFVGTYKPLEVDLVYSS